MAHSVQDHYGGSDIVGRVLAAVPWSPESGSPLTAPQLFPFDQLHGRELAATRDHAARLAPDATAHVLDVGSGIGGPARYIATTFGCRVTGVDLTPQFVEAATELTRACGLSETVSFDQANATVLPYGDAVFDHAYCFYVGMNLPDKPAVLRQIARVLKPGGRLIWTEAVAAGDPPHYPLPWSATPDGSHLHRADTLREMIKAAGFDVIAVEDETRAQLDLVDKMRQAGFVPSELHVQANEVVLGPDFGARRRNYIRNLAEGRIAALMIDATKP